MIGVVIGSFGMPSVVALNVAAIRASNPDARILVYDDATPSERDPTGFFQRQSTHTGQSTHADGFEFHQACVSHGHIGGDVRAFTTGLQWASSLGLKYLVKLSQRFIIHAPPGWLARTCHFAETEQVITASQKAMHGSIRPWGDEGIRTECMLLRVADWARPEVLKRLLAISLTPEVWLRKTAEELMHPGKPITRWRLYGPDKNQRRTGILWHDANTEEEYHALAKSLGVKLEGYSNAGWNVLLGSNYRWT